MITFGSFIHIYIIIYAYIYTLYNLDFTTAIVYISLMFSLQFADAVFEFNFCFLAVTYLNY